MSEHDGKLLANHDGIRLVLRDYRFFHDRIRIGVLPSDDDFLALHQELGKDLEREVKRARRLMDARAAADLSKISLECPHCNQLLSVLAAESDDEILCSSCKSTFRVADVSGTKISTKVEGEIERATSTSRIPHDKLIGDFELKRLLGRGGFGEVWLATDHRLSRSVAIKIATRISDEDRTRFRWEAEASAKLRHPNIVEVYQAGEFNDNLYIATRYVEGRSLRDWMKENASPDIQLAAKWCQRLADALHEAHCSSIIHRDVKPENVLLENDANPCLVDFGLSRDLTRDTTMTRPGAVIGSPAYMSPQQAAGKSRELEGSTDIYSLGVILYELMTGLRPFQGIGIQSLLRQIMEDDPKPPRLVNNDVPEDLNQICLKCLRKNEADRYETAQELADDLQRFLNGEEVLARPLPPLLRTWRWCQRNPKRAAAYLRAGLVVVIAVLGASYAAFDRYVQVDEARGIAESALNTSERRRTETLSWLNVAHDSLGKSLQLGRTFESFPEMRSAYSAFLERAARDYQQLAERISDDPELEVRRAQVWLILTDIRRDLGDLKGASRSCDTARAILQTLDQPEADSLVQIELANSLNRQASLVEEQDRAIDLSKQAILSLEKLISETETVSEYAQFSLAAALLNHGSLHIEMKQLDHATDLLSRSVEQFQWLLKAAPSDSSFTAGLANGLTLLGRAASGKGDHSEAISRIRQGLATLASSINDHGADTFLLMSRAAGHGDLAAVLDAAGRTDEALAEWQASVETWGELANRVPDVSRYYEQFVLREIDCGQAMYDAGRLRRAEPLLNDAHARIEEELEYVPGDPVWLEIQGLCFDAKARLQSARGQADVALELSNAAIRAFDSVAEGEPDNLEIIFRTALARNHRGQIEHSLGDSEAGVRSIEEAEAILKTLTEEHLDWPRLHFAQEQAAFCLRERGVVLSEMGRTEEATTALRAAIDSWEKLIDEYGLPRFRNNLAWFLIEVPVRPLRDAGQAAALATSLREELPTNPAYAALHGAALSVAGLHEESIAVLKEVTGQHPDRRARDWLYLARSQAKLQQADKSIENLQRGSEWMEVEMPTEPWLTRLHAEISEIIKSERPQ